MPIFLFRISGTSRLLHVGNSVFVWHDIRCCMSELFKPSVGVLHLSKKAFSGSLPSSLAFQSDILAVFTAFSAFPLLCG